MVNVLPWSCFKLLNEIVVFTERKEISELSGGGTGETSLTMDGLTLIYIYQRLKTNIEYNQILGGMA